MLKKYCFITALVVLSLSLPYNIYSYTYAFIKNDTSLKVSATSSNSLIGIQDDVELEVMQGNIDTANSIEITNNSFNSIWVDFIFETHNTGITITSDYVQIDSGDTKKINLYLSADDEAVTGIKPIDYTLYAQWDGGKATIDNSVLVNILPKPEPELMLEPVLETQPKPNTQSKLKSEPNSGVNSALEHQLELKSTPESESKVKAEKN